MTEFKVEMRRAEGISDEERRRRISAAYQIILDAARRKRTAERDELGNPDRSAASEEPAATPDTQGV